METTPQTATRRTRHRVVVDDTPLATSIGGRLRAARLRAGLPQAQLAGERYTKAYVSALENGSSKPSMAALNYFAEQLSVAATVLIADESEEWGRLEGDILLAAGRWQDALDIYDRHLLEGPSGGERAELLRGRAEALARLDRGAEATTAASEAAEIFGKLGRDADATLATYWIANGEYLQGNFGEARRHLEAALTKVRAGLRIEPDFHLRLVIALAGVETHDGDHDQALALLSQVRGLADGLDDRRRATYYFDLATSYRETGDYEAAVRAGYSALTLFSAMHADSETAALENDLALDFLKLGNMARAKELAGSARRSFEALRDARWLAHVVDTEAQIALAGGEMDEATVLAARAIEGALSTGNTKAHVDGLVTRAEIKRRGGDVKGAEVDYRLAADLARAAGSRGRVRDALTAWSEMIAESGDMKRAYELMREAMSA